MLKNKKDYKYYLGGSILIIIILILCISSCSKGYKVELKIGNSVYYQGKLHKGDTLEKIDIPEQVGYTFAGWYLGDEKYDLDTPITEDMELEAKFIKNRYIITIQNDMDSKNDSIIKEVEYGETIEELETPKKTGYTFLGWFNGEEKYDFSTKIKSNITLTAKWEKKTHANYTIEHYLMNLDGSYNEEADEIEVKNGKIGQIVTLDVKSYEGFKSPKVQRKEILEDNQLIVKYYYERNQYNLNVTGDSGIDTLEGNGKYYYGEKVEIHATIKDGYTFEGWSNGEKDFDFTYTVKDKNDTITALTTLNKYSITYDLNGGKLENLPEEYTAESERIFLGVPKKEGYTFSYWLINGKKTAGIINTGTTGNLEAKAIFKANTDTPYIIQYYFMDVKGQEYVLNKKQTKNRKGTTDTKIEFTPEEMEGFKTPILKDKNGNEVELEDLVITGDGTTELNYYYEREKYTLTLEFDQGIEQVLGAGEYYYKEKVNISAIVKNGYTFTGWSNEEKNLEFTYTMKASSETLKATTSMNTYSITYNLNGGSLENPKNEYTVESDEFNLGVPTKEGYTFTHWVVNGEESDGKIVKGTYGDLEVEAIFTANTDTPYTIHYYLMNVTGETYDLQEDFTELKNGTTDTIIEYTPKNIEGFKTPILKDKDGKEVKLEDLVITGDGKTELNYYYERKQYTLTISFINKLDSKDREGISSISKTGTYYYETEVNISIALKDGFELIKWSNGTTDSAFTYTITSLENQKLEAEIQRISYKVDFDSNNGSSVESKTVLFGKQIPEPETPNRSGHDFVGWFKTEECTEEWNFDTDKMPNHDVTLYAKWNIHKNTVVFDANGGKFSDNKKTHDLPNQEVGSKITSPNENPTKEGYTFDGWFKDNLGNEEWKFENDSESNTMPDESLTLYAKWTANTYTIKFNGNDNTSGETKEIKCTYDQECQLTQNGYTKEYVVTYNENKNEDVENSTQNVKYNFENWSYQGKTYSDGEKVKNLTTEANGEVTLTAEWNIDQNTTSLKAVERTGYQFDGWYSNSQLIENLNDISTNLDLTANWIANTYHIVYDSNKGEGSTIPSGEVNSTEHKYDEIKDLNSIHYSREGYTFLGWSKNQYKTSVETCEDCITSANNLTDKNDDTITLYAVWSANHYTVTYDGNNKTSGDMSPTTCIFDQNCQLSQNVFIKEYAISFDKNDTTEEMNNTKTVKYKFQGWKNDTNTYDDNSKVKNLTSEKDGNVTLTAEWLIDKSTTTLEDVSRTGYDFDGWFKEDNEEVNDLSSVQEDLVLQAHWTPITYKIIFDGNGGESTDGQSRVEITATYDVSEQALEAFHKSYDVTYHLENGSDDIKDSLNAEFKNWKLNDKKINAGESLGNLTSIKGEEITLKAEYDNPEYKIEKENPTKENNTQDQYYKYEFKDWTDGEHDYQKESTLTLTEDIELNAEYLKVIDSKQYIEEKMITEGRKDFTTSLTGNTYTIDIVDVNASIIVATDIQKIDAILNNEDVLDVKLSSASNIKNVTLKEEDNIESEIKSFLSNITNTTPDKLTAEKHLSSLFEKSISVTVDFDPELAKTTDEKSSVSYNLTYTNKNEHIITQEMLYNYADSGIKPVNQPSKVHYSIKRNKNEIRATYASADEKAAVVCVFHSMGCLLSGTSTSLGSGNTGMKESITTYFKNKQIASIDILKSDLTKVDSIDASVGEMDNTALVTFAANMLYTMGIIDKKPTGSLAMDALSMTGVKSKDMDNKNIKIRVNLNEGYIFEDGVDNLFNIQILNPEEYAKYNGTEVK